MSRILSSNLGRKKELEYLMKLRHRISFIGGEVIPANTELTKDQEAKAKKAGGKFHEAPKKAKKPKSKPSDESGE